MVEITIRKRPAEDAVISQRKFFKKTARGKVVKGLP
jgi:exosome complex exonuclease DIS3/RRP44